MSIIGTHDAIKRITQRMGRPVSTPVVHAFMANLCGPPGDDKNGMRALFDDWCRRNAIANPGRVGSVSMQYSAVGLRWSPAGLAPTNATTRILWAKTQSDIDPDLGPLPLGTSYTSVITASRLEENFFPLTHAFALTLHQPGLASAAAQQSAMIALMASLYVQLQLGINGMIRVGNPFVYPGPQMVVTVSPGAAIADGLRADNHSPEDWTPCDWWSGPDTVQGPVTLGPISLPSGAGLEDVVFALRHFVYGVIA